MRQTVGQWLGNTQQTARDKLHPLRVWLLVAAVWGLGALLVDRVSGLTPIASPQAISWWLILPVFIATQAKPVNFEWRGQAWLVTLCPLPLILGLFFVDPLGLLAARSLGAILGAVLARRLPNTKVAFNIGLVIVDTAVAILVFQSLVRGYPLASPHTWLAALSASAATEVTDAALLSVAIRLTSPAWQWRSALAPLLVSTASSGAFTVLAIVAASAVLTDSRVTYLLIALAMLTVVVAHAYSRLAEQHARLARLYAASNIVWVPWTADLEGLHRGLDQIREMIYADQLEILDLSQEAGRPLLLTFSSAGPSTGSRGLDPAEQRAATSAQARLIRVTDSSHPRRWSNDMVAPLEQEGQVLGVIRARSRTGQVRRFDRRDLALLEAAAGQVTAALQMRRATQATPIGKDDYDPATGLHRSGRAEEFLARLSVGDHAGVVVAISIKGLVDIASAFGDAAQSYVLKTVSERLLAAVGNDVLLTRGDGSDYLAVVPLSAVEKAGLLLATGLQSAGSGFLETSWGVLDITLLVGVARCSNDTNARQVIVRATKAVSDAHLGIDRVVEWQPDLQAESTRQLTLSALIHKELAGRPGSVHVMYQPIVCLSKKDAASLVGYEALARFQGGGGALVGPSEFVPLLEATGGVQLLTEAVLGTALKDLPSLTYNGFMAVNLSPTLLDSDAIVEDVERLLNVHSIAAQRLTLELTESHLVVATKQRLRRLHQLQALGVNLAIDDFGTGYSSLAYLHHLPMRELKLDKTFVVDLEENSRAQQLVGSITAMVHDLGMVITAEGIERPSQQALLASLDVDRGQGFLFGPAASPSSPAPNHPGAGSSEPWPSILPTAP